MCLLMDEGFVLLAVWDVNMNGVLLGRNVGSDVCKCIVMGEGKELLYRAARNAVWIISSNRVMICGERCCIVAFQMN